MTKIRQGNWDTFDSYIQRSLFRLTLRDGSGMRTSLHELRARGKFANEPGDHKVFVAFDFVPDPRRAYVGGITVTTEQPVGWALVTWDNAHGEYDIQLYVKRSERRFGHGRRLFKKAQRWAHERGEFCFFSEPLNEEFFEEMGVMK